MAVAVEIPRRLFTVDEYRRMAEAGILREKERVAFVIGLSSRPRIPSRSDHALSRSRMWSFSGRARSLTAGSFQPPRMYCS